MKLSNCVSLSVPNRAAAIELYSSILGEPRSDHGEVEWTAEGKFRLFVDETKAYQFAFEYIVPDHAAAVEMLKQKGFVELKDEGGNVYMKDPFGYVWHLWEESRGSTDSI